jgi:hypothetical protein
MSRRQFRVFAACRGWQSWGWIITSIELGIGWDTMAVKAVVLMSVSNMNEFHWRGKLPFVWRRLLITLILLPVN